MTLDLEAGRPDHRYAQNLADVLAVEIAQANRPCFALVDKSLHSLPSCGDIILHQNHFTVHVLPFGWVLLFKGYELGKNHKVSCICIQG